MKIRPMIGEFVMPGISRIGTVEKRCLVNIPVPGMAGDYIQDLGNDSTSIKIEGTLAGDDARDNFLNNIRDKFKTGEPVDFVADITTATEIDKVMIKDLIVAEVAGSTDTFRYSIVLSQFIEPRIMPADTGLDFGDLSNLEDLADLDAVLDLEAASIFDAMQIPDLLNSIPDFRDPTPPLKGVIDGVKSALDGFGDVSSGLKELFGEVT